MSEKWEGWLPPVGECMANQGSDNDYFHVEVVGHHYKTGRPILSTRSIGSELVHAPECWNFRPIRTAEEVAVEAIGGIVAYEAGWKSRPCNETANAIYAAIRDGKIPGVKLED